MPRDAKQLSWVMEFSVGIEQPLWILFLAYILFARQLHLNLCMGYFINILLKYLQFLSRNFRFKSYLWHWHRNVWWKIDVKMSKRQPVIMQERSHLTPRGVSQHFLAPVSHMEIPLGYVTKDVYYTILYVLSGKVFNKEDGGRQCRCHQITRWLTCTVSSKYNKLWKVWKCPCPILNVIQTGLSYVS